MPLITANRLVESVECPKCGKHTIVKHGDAYHCLNCSFTRDLSEDLSTSLTQFLSVSQDGQLIQALEVPSEATQGDLHPILFIAIAILFGLFVI